MNLTHHHAMRTGVTAALLSTALTFAASLLTVATAQERPQRDALSLDASVTEPVSPDTAVVLMSAERQGSDAAAATSEVNQTLAAALKDAKATPGVHASTANFSTWPRYDAKGQRAGWVVRGDLLLKSRDFTALGKLAGRLSTSMNIQSNGFEVSPELKDAEEKKLIERALAAFRAKALTATKALGYSSFAIAQVTLGSAQVQGTPGPRPMMMQAKAMVASDAAPMPIESGVSTLSLSVSGTVIMK